MGLERLVEIFELARERVTNGLTIINSDHSNIHKGLGYSFHKRLDSMTSAQVVTICLTTAEDVYVHVKDISLQVVGGSVLIEILRGADVTVNTGTAVALRQKNFNSANTASTTLKEAPTYTGGTVGESMSAIASTTLPSKGAASVATNPNEEIVLEPDSQYIIKITNLESATIGRVDIRGFLYEEDSGLVS